ncbi:unnamed protein product [Aphanomyces euteiches]
MILESENEDDDISFFNDFCGFRHQAITSLANAIVSNPSNIPPSLAQVANIERRLRDPEQHSKLRGDIIENLWFLRGLQS